LQLASAGGLALIAAMVGIIAWTLRDGHEDARRQAEQQGGNIALTLDRDIDRVITSLDLSLQAAVRGMATPGLAAMDPQLRQAILFDGALAAEDFGGVFISDASGHVIYTSHGPEPRNVNVADRPYFRTQRDNSDLRLVISPPLRSRNDGEWTIALARRINHPDGTFAGTAVAALRLAYFQHLFGALNLGKYANITLRSTDGILITREPYLESEIGRDARDSAISRAFAKAPSGQFQVAGRLDGIDRHDTYRQIGDWPLVLGVGLADRDIYADWTVKALIIGGALLLLAAAKLAMARQLTRELARRIAAEATASDAAAEATNLARELSAALAPLDALFRHSADTMLAVRITPSGQFIYEAVNPVWQDLFGISAEIAIGRSPNDILPPPLAATILAGWHEAQQQRRAIRFEFSTDFASATRDWEAMAVPVIDDHGDISRLIIVARELTERNRLAEQLRQAQKMQVIGQLASGVAHDFNNILQAIASGVELLKNERFISESGRDFLDVIGRATHRGSYLTHHLLSYSGRQMHDPKPSDVTQLLDRLRGMLLRTLGPAISLTIEIGDSIGMVSIDRGQFETAVMNLAINASHAMPSGGGLHIHVGSAEAEPFGELKPGRHVVIAVTDTGTGIPPDVMARIFDPFFTTKGAEGTGLGLPMVQGFCRQSGGDVRVSSAPGKGTCFEIWLPEAAATTPHHHPVERLAPAGQAARVLLVDDAADVLILLDAFLRGGGFTVHQAQGGQQALAALAAGERFDVLVTDYMMPEMNGVALIAHARAIQPGLPALVISGFSDAADFMSSLPDALVLHKPFNRDQLITQIAALLPAGAAADAHHAVGG
jgi:PAS domain S-box-containing protein